MSPLLSGRRFGRAVLSSLPLLALSPLAAAHAPASALDLDLLAVHQDRNDVQIPNSAAGSRVDLAGVLGDGPWTSVRLTWVTPGLGEGQQWRVMLAPLEIESAGMLRAPLAFNGAAFAPGLVRAGYRFNSWRVSYRWPLWRTAHWQWHAGLTAKVRDAEISFSQAGVAARKANLGLVPLAHVAGEARYGDWRVSVDGDGLASPQGHAFDIGARVGYAFTPAAEAYAGLRTLEGGADNDEVYNFAWFNQVSLGVRARY